uniref:Intraflagellar transport protein 52 n=1 Tax=Palpitomonas bilix TaxID=652834 RepID=A0A7S3DER4_9EUKA|mmetsp:Transcript_34667/g.89912  ORF Transcript_34667/g.89912 Transcript_34667/m.89912 type:complete len:471 (+) Transcript_34667:67-1479(+)
MYGYDRPPKNQGQIPADDLRDGDQRPLVLFDCSKRETHSPEHGLKHLVRRLKQEFRIEVNKEPLRPELVDTVSILVIAGPREKFSSDEFDTIKALVKTGKSVFVMLGEGGESRFNTNINYLLEEYGVMINSDCVVRTIYHKYLHPKEVCVSDGVVNREVKHFIRRQLKSRVETKKNGVVSKEQEKKEATDSNVSFVYPYGSTLNVQQPAVPLLSSGQLAYPINRPLAAIHVGQRGIGKLIVMGSVHVFDDQWLGKEENAKVQDLFFRWLIPGAEVKLDPIDAREPDLHDYNYVPDIEALAERPRSCLQEAEELPRDFSTLFDDGMFRFDTSHIPSAVNLYDEMDVKHDTLTLIPPQFEAPLPPLQPAAFPPTLHDIANPALDLFDLDEQFASEKVRLAQLTNKCTEDDLDYYVKECCDVLGVTQRLPDERKGAKDALAFVLQQLVNFKKLNTPEMGASAAPRSSPTTEMD